MLFKHWENRECVPWALACCYLVLHSCSPDDSPESRWLMSKPFHFDNRDNALRLSNICIASTFLLRWNALSVVCLPAKRLYEIPRSFHIESGPTVELFNELFAYRAALCVKWTNSRVNT